MITAMVHVDILETRRRLGHDKKDEVWAGVLHMVPPPTSRHQLTSGDLNEVLRRIARRHGWKSFAEGGLYNPAAEGDDYRVPDLMFATPDRVSGRGVEGVAELVVEILSPRDESRAKLVWYAEMGVREVWLLDPRTRAIEVFVPRDGAMVPLDARGGAVGSPVLGVELTTVEGKLRIRDGEQVDEV